MSSLTIKPGSQYTNEEFLSFAGALPGGTADTLTDAGVLVNVGELALHGGIYGKAGGASVAGPGASALITSGGLLTNLGLVDVSDGGGGPATLTIATGGSLSQNQSATLNINGNGTVEVAGTLVSAGFIDVGAADASPGSALYYPGELAILPSGTLLNSGSLTLAGGPAPSAGVPANVAGALVTDAGVLTNTGIITVNGGGATSSEGAFGGGALLDINSGGVLTNLGTLYIEPGGADVYSVFPPNDPGQVYIQGLLVNEASLNIVNYTPKFDEEAIGGELTIAAGGTLLNTGTLQLDYGPVATSSSGSFTQAGQVTIDSGGTLWNEGTILASGTLSIASGGYLGDLAGVLSSNHITSGLISVGVGGSLDDAGLLAIDADTINVRGMPVPISSGTLVVGAGGWISIDETGNLQDNGYVVVDGEGELYDDGTLGGSGAIRNLSVMDLDASAKVSVASIINDDFIDATGNSLEILSSVSADAGKTGHIWITSGNTLALDNSVTGQTIGFLSHDNSGTNLRNTLQIGSIAQFHAVISDVV